MDQVKFYKGCLPQILLGPFLNTLNHLQNQQRLVVPGVLKRQCNIPIKNLGLFVWVVGLVLCLLSVKLVFFSLSMESLV